MSDKLLIYGAYGYTGELTARIARDKGMTPVLAGRNAEKTSRVAQRYGLTHRVFGLDDPQALDQGLADIEVVLHAAGPFSRTAKPMVAACLRTKTHYLDITGELEVFESHRRLGGRATEAGIMLMSGTGFDVVPTDCLAQHLKNRLPDATHLVLAFRSSSGVSHGTATTMVENLHRGSFVRREGELVGIPAGSLTKEIDFGRGPRHCVAIPWGDLATAFYSTSIPNVAVFVSVPKPMSYGMRALGLMGPLLSVDPVQNFLKRRVDSLPAGPSDDQRKQGSAIIWGEVRNADGTIVSARLRTPEGYTLTALTSLGIANRVLDGDAPVGYQTPSKAYGADLVLGFEGVELQDL